MPRIEFGIRPHAIEFLHEMREHFELVIFTAADQSYADDILERLDPSGVISHRLYRQHAVHFLNVYHQQTTFIKDLSRLGRDLSTVVIVDNLKENFMWQPKNGIHIKTWTSDQDDESLLMLIPLLKQACEAGSDIRESLCELREASQQ